MMNLAAMVDEIGRAVNATVSRSIAPLAKQIEDLIAWREAVGEVRSGSDGTQGLKGDPGPAGKDAPAVDVDALIARLLPLIPVAKDGRDGRDGTDGAPGPSGKDGADGRDGLDGVTGMSGADGKDGLPGDKGEAGEPGNGIKQFEFDQKSMELDIVLDSGDHYSLKLPDPPRGEKGEPGQNGSDGEPGMRGEKGDPPSEAEVAAAIQKACDATLPGLINKHLEAVLPEVVTRASLLVPPGRDGLPGRPGTQGDPGSDGVGLKDIRIEKSGPRVHELSFKMTDGSLHKHEIRLDGMLMDADVHRPGASYEKGDVVTHGGNYWVAKANTSEGPGTSPSWRLVVRKGRDGKDAE